MTSNDRIVSASDFLIKRPFGKASRELLSEWYDAANIFINARQNITLEDDLVASVNDCFPSLHNHSPNYDHHIWGEKRNTYVSARRVKNSSPQANKTRAYLVLESMFQGFSLNTHPLFERADITDRRIRVPSPLLFLRKILTSDEFLASESYAHAIIRAEIFASGVRSFPPSESQNLYEYLSQAISYQSVSESINTMISYQNRRESTYISKIIEFIVGNYFASLGLAQLSFSRRSVDIRPKRNEYRLFSIDEFLNLKSLDILPNKTRDKRDDLGYEIKLTVTPKELPSISQILNDLEGIPCPVPGASTVFAGGIRMTEHGGAVIRISGKSGTGKTSLALATCVGLAPLGTETFYLSCEEEREDLIDRISTVTPTFISSTRTYSHPSLGADQVDDWFHAYHLDHDDSRSNFADALSFVDQIEQQYKDSQIGQPRFRPPGVVPYVVVLDGIHELVEREAHEFHRMDEGGGDTELESPIEEVHKLINRYRKLNVLVILVSAAVDSLTFNSIDYLVDVVVDLDNTQTIQEPHKPLRTASLTKTRRQFSNTGTHKFHISKRDGVRFYPNLEATLERYKSRDWQQPDERFHFDFFGRTSTDGTRENWLKIFLKSHTLIAGRGSGGKAGFALRLLTAPIVGDPKNESFESSDLGLLEDAPKRRCLIVSFLYPASYYDELVQRIRNSVFSDFATDLPKPRFQYSVLTFYPGYVAPEVLLTKISDEIRASELQGYPFDCVLVDGLHNVFLQFPLIEANTLIWPMLSEMFRRLGVSVVTTHSHFDVLGMEEAALLLMDVKAIANRSTPLLQSLVNSADYYIDISFSPRNDKLKNRSDRDNLYAVRIATAFGQAVPRSEQAYWNREAIQVVPVE